MNGRTLVIVEVDMSDDSGFKSQEQIGRIFPCRRSEIGESAGSRLHTLYFSEEPVEIVDGVNQSQNHSSTEIAPCTVAPAIILPRMPTWQILTPFRSGAQYLS